MRKTKIICTLGPATDQGDVLEQLMLSGMNVARLNFSHDTYENQKKRMDKVKALRQKHNLPVACLLDTKGPEVRLKTFKDKKVTLERGQEFCLTTRDVEGTKEIVSVTHKDLHNDIKAGSSILIDDGLVELKVVSIKGQDIHCKVLNGGVISDRKGVNIPGVELSIPFMSDKDKEDLLFGIKEDVDFIAASFTRTADDILEMKQFLKENGGENIHIIAKIENSQGVDNIDEIINVCEGIMVARGDMGVEIPEEEVPIIQKMIIKKVIAAGKIVITATQMLDSMMKNPRPTRAETTDVANAIFDGTSAIMLSGETAAGAYPVEAVQMMARIASRTEQAINYHGRFDDLPKSKNPNITDAICHATCSTAYDLDAKAIITVTKTGFSARMISRYRPGCDIFGCAMDEKVCRQLNLAWGVYPVLLGEEWEVFVLFERAINACKKQGLLQNGDVTVITSGVPIGRSGTTNMLKVQVVSE
ncbi:MAG: pyruvate kinase [Eubacterium sp.]|nr:pyruvate kinase [Eubacterium sp.]MDD7210127.1 pyruvate kinase [Lachnospiraceae bacterium]MDY5496499.1 pyruvate kinase [Anaerobutyricum sp.]